MRKFTALYTHQKLKKAKTWQDGFAHYKQESNELVLYDSSHGRLANYRLRAKESIDLSTEYDVGRFLLTLEEEEGDDTPKEPSEPISTALKEPVRRTKRPASLIKPIRLKKPPETADSSAPATNQPAKDKDDDCIRYTALYTTQKVKKLKAWSDGEIAYVESTNRITLKDGDGNTLASMHIPAKTLLEAGSEFDCGRFLIQVDCIKGQAANVDSTAIPAGLQLQGSLKKQHGNAAPKKRPLLVRSSSSKPKLARLTKTPSAESAISSESVSKRMQFVPPTQHIPKHLHFPRRSELLQHVSVSKGYGIGPPRKLTAPVKYTEWKEYQRHQLELLRENLMAELSALAIRYFFMARERTEQPSRNKAVKRSLVQTCKSVGVQFYEGCTLRQAFMDNSAFLAQRNSNKVELGPGDSVSLELSRREARSGYAKDDTWAISTSTDFPLDQTFLARSVFFGPNKNNVLELALVGDEDAKVAARLFNEEQQQQKPQRGLRYVKATPTVVAIRCLDSSSDWAMLDMVRQLDPETYPFLPNLLDIASASTFPIDHIVDPGEVLERVKGIISAHSRRLALNVEQAAVLRSAVLSAVSAYIPVPDTSAITIVHGPFGTGKSFLVAAITLCLEGIASEFPSVFASASDAGDSEIEVVGDSKKSDIPRLRVLLASMTNFAVDNMLAALLDQEYDEFARVGSLRRVAKRILPYVHRSAASAADDIRELEQMLEAAEEGSDEHDAIGIALQRLRQPGDAQQEAFVVGTTCLSANAAALRGSQFPVVILDEASQIVEPMALLALSGCRRLVLVGDPLQLPPTLTTRSAGESEGRGLDRALFDRLVQMGHHPCMLTTQYRCHPRIATLCSRLFYSNRLSHGVSPDARPPLVPQLPPLAFLDTAGREQQQGASQSFYNRGEIDMAVQLTMRLLMHNIRPESIGVIALYKTQADMLRDRLRELLGARGCVQVSTVDAYQGSERDIIIISCVRTDKIGFIANPNRVNVALSRARHHCLVLGSKALLQTNNMWRTVIEYCREDPDGRGVVGAQSLVNQISASLATIADTASNSSGDAAAAAEPQLEQIVVDSELCSVSSVHSFRSDGDGQSDDEADFGEQLADEEGVVGGMLSQWSQYELGGSNNSFLDHDEDVLDCLDVDIDEM